MSRQQIAARYAQLLGRWPIDRLRPDNVHFQRVLKARTRDTGPTGPTDVQELNAGFALLNNSFSKNYPLSARTMKPTSNPEHYKNLAKELEEAPDRSWLQRVAKRLRGMVRLR